MRIDGQIHIGEAARWAGRACGRLNGYPWTSLVAGVAIGALAVAPPAILAALAVRVLDAPGWANLPILLAALVPSMMVAIRLVRGLIVRHFRKQLMARGVSNPLPYNLELEGGEVRWVAGDIDSRAPISAVSEVFPVGPYWVMLIQGTPVFVARRHFPDEAAQRAFLSALLPQMTDDARRRSAAAARFAGG